MNKSEREMVLELVARLAASPKAELQREALRLAERYRDVILRGPDNDPLERHAA